MGLFDEIVEEKRRKQEGLFDEIVKWKSSLNPEKTLPPLPTEVAEKAFTEKVRSNVTTPRVGIKVPFDRKKMISSSLKRIESHLNDLTPSKEPKELFKNILPKVGKPKHLDSETEKLIPTKRETKKSKREKVLANNRRMQIFNRERELATAFDDTTPLAPEESSVFGETLAIFEKQAAFLALYANAFGLINDSRELAEFIANRSRALANAQKYAPEYMRTFMKKYMEAEGFFSKAAIIALNPRALGRLTITQIPNSILPLTSAFLGGAVGQGMVPIPGVGAMAGAGIGAFAGGALVEAGAWLDQELTERGVDMTDPDQVFKAMQDDDLMDEIASLAQKKGMVTAGIDALTLMFGGKIIKGAVPGKGTMRRTSRVVSNFGLEMVSEGGGEFAGASAAGKGDAGEALLESFTAGAQSGGQVLQSLALAKDIEGMDTPDIPEALTRESADREMQTLDHAATGASFLDRQATDIRTPGSADVLSARDIDKEGLRKQINILFEKPELIRQKDEAQMKRELEAVLADEEEDLFSDRNQIEEIVDSLIEEIKDGNDPSRNLVNELLRSETEEGEARLFRNKDLRTEETGERFSPVTEPAVEPVKQPVKQPVEPTKKSLLKKKETKKEKVLQFPKEKTEIGRFAKKLKGKVEEGVKSTINKVKDYKEWKYKKGDRIRSEKTGKVWVVEGRTWNNQLNHPVYTMSSPDGNERASFNALKVHDTFESNIKVVEPELKKKETKPKQKAEPVPKKKIFTPKKIESKTSIEVNKHKVEEYNSLTEAHRIAEKNGVTGQDVLGFMDKKGVIHVPTPELARKMGQDRNALLNKAAKGKPPAVAGREKPGRLSQSKNIKPIGKESITKDAVKLFGTTNDPAETGYILPDGTMLKLFDRNAGLSEFEHADVGRIEGVEGLLEGTAIADFQNKTGAVRIGNAVGGHISFSVTEGQNISPTQWGNLNKIAKDLGVGIGNVTADINSTDGGKILFGFNFDSVNQARRAIEDFKSGKKITRDDILASENIQAMVQRVLSAPDKATKQAVKYALRFRSEGGFADIWNGIAKGTSKREAKKIPNPILSYKVTPSLDAQKILEDLINIFDLNNRDVTTLQDIKDRAREMGMDVRNLIRMVTNKKNMALHEQVEAIRQQMHDSGKRHDRWRKEWHEVHGVDPKKASEAAKKMAEEVKLQSTLLKLHVKGLNEAGLALRIQREIAQTQAEGGELDLLYWMEIARKKAEGRIGEKKLNLIYDRIRHIVAHGTPNEMAEFIKTLTFSTNIEKGVALFKTGLLTAFGTHVANIMGTLSFQMLDTIASVPATGIDILVASLMRGKGNRTTTLASPIRQLKALGIEVKIKNGVPKFKLNKQGALRIAGRYFKTGEYRDNVRSKYDLPEKTTFNHWLPQIYVDTVMNALSMEDIFFKEMVIMDSLEQQAIIEAKNMASRGEIAKSKIKEKIRSILIDPPEPMVLNAINDAERVTFQNKNAIANAVTSFKNPGVVTVSETGVASAQLVTLAADIVAPFVRTPTNVAMRIAEFSPVGFVQAIYKAIHPSIRAELKQTNLFQKEMISKTSKALTGTGVIYAGWALAAAGLLVGDPPDDENERDFWYLEGKKRNGLLWKGEYRSFNRISPIGNLLGIGALIYESMERGRNPVVDGILGGLKMLTEQTFLRGVSGALKAVNNPDQYGESYVNLMMGSLIPNIFTKMARIYDPYQVLPEDGRGVRIGVWESWKSRLPFLSKNVSVRVDALGNKVYYPGGDGTKFYKRALEVFFDPFPATKKSDNPLIEEAKRIGVTINIPSRTISGIRLRSKEWQIFQQYQGKALERRLFYLTRQPNYIRAGGTIKQAELWEKAEREVAKYHNDVYFPTLMVNRYKLPDHFRREPYYKAIREVLSNASKNKKWERLDDKQQRKVLIIGLKQRGFRF